MRSLRLLKVWKVLAPCMKGLVLWPALALPPSMHMFSRSLLAGNLLQESDSGHCRLNSCRIRRHAAFTRSHSGLQGPAVLQCQDKVSPSLVSPMRVCAGSCACSPGSCTHIGTWTLQRKNWSSGLQPIRDEYYGHVTIWRVLIGHLQPYWIRGRKVSSPALASPCSWCPIMFGMPVLLYSVAHCNYWLNIYIVV